MALGLLIGAIPNHYKEDSASAPLSSYLPDTLVRGSFLECLVNNTLWKCTDDSDQSNLGWQMISSFSGSYTDLTNKPTIPTISIPVYSSPTFSNITTATQLSTTQDAYVNYVFPTSMTSLLTSQSLTATLQYADNSGMSTNLVTVSSDVNGCSGIISLTLSGRLQLSGRIPGGKFRKVTLSQTGGATVPTTISSSQEVLV